MPDRAAEAIEELRAEVGEVREQLNRVESLLVPVATFIVEMGRSKKAMPPGPRPTARGMARTPPDDATE